MLTLMFAPNGARAEQQDPSAPPFGILPTSMTLARLMRLHQSAVGSAPTTGGRTRVEARTYLRAELQGTQTRVESPAGYLEETTLGPFHTAHGSLHGKSWMQNENGLTRELSDLHQRDAIDRAALANASDPKSGVSLLGEVTAPVAAYVVRVFPPGGRVEYLFYDRASYLLVRSERQVVNRRVVTTYDDFRDTGGWREAWHIHASNGLAYDDEDWRLQSLSFGAVVDEKSFAQPQSRGTVMLGQQSTALPATLSGDRVILTAELGGHKVNLQLDSGAAGILLDRSVADAVHVTSYGRLTQDVAGEFTASPALIPVMAIGGATMNNVAVETAPYGDRTYDGYPVAGLLGYDFIAGCVVHIDYLNKKVEAIDAGSFSAPQGAFALPIRLDDGVPVVSARVGSATANAFIVDTGADRSVIFSGFARAHAADVSESGVSETMTNILPFPEKSHGVGGSIETRIAQVPSLGLGPLTFPNWRFDVTQNALAFEDEDYDGLIGQDVLRNFDVYLDYHDLKIYLLPNERYRQRWGSN